MKRFLLKFALILCLALSFSLALVACKDKDPNAGGNPPPVVDAYYDDATDTDKVIGNFIKVDGQFTETAWKGATPYVVTKDGVTLAVKTIFFDGGQGVRVNLKDANAYFSKDNIEDSAYLKVKIGSPNALSGDTYRVLTILMDGRTRLEEVSPSGVVKVTDVNKCAAITNGDDGIDFEFTISSFDLDWVNQSIMFAFEYNNPVNEALTDSNLIAFNNDFYIKDAPYTWNAFTVGKYLAPKTFKNSLYVNPVNNLFLVDTDFISYSGSDYTEIPVKNTDVAKRITSTFKSDGLSDFDAGYKYGNTKIGIKKQTSGDFYFVGGETEVKLTQTQKQALTSVGLTYSALFDGEKIIAYVELNNEVQKVAEVNVSNADSLVIYSFDSLTVSSLKLGDETFKVINTLKNLTVTVNEYSYGGRLSITVGADSNVGILSLSVAGEPIEIDGSTSYTVVVDNFTEMFAVVLGEVTSGDLTLTLYATAGSSKPWLLPNGTEVKLKAGDAEFKTIVSEDGSCFISDIPYGTYIIESDFYISASVDVSKNNLNISKTLVYDIFNEDGSDWTVSDDQTEFYVTGTSHKGLYLNEVHDNYVMSFKMVSTIPTDKTASQVCNENLVQHITNTGLRIYNGNGANDHFTMNLLYWFASNNTGGGQHYWMIKTQGVLAASDKLPDSSYHDFNGDGIELKFIKVGNTFSAYYVYNGEINFIEGVISDKEILKVSFNYWDNPIVKVKDFSYEPIEPNVDIKYIIENSNDGKVHGSLDVLHQGIGKDLIITTIPEDGYLPTSISVNGHNYTEKLRDGKVTIKESASIQYNIVVRYEKAYVLTGKVKSEVADLTDRRIELVCAENNVTYYTNIDKDGNYYFEDLFSLGQYNVYSYGLGTTSFTLTEEILNSGKLDLVFNNHISGLPTGWSGDFDELNYYTEDKRGTLSILTQPKYAEMVVYNPIEGQGDYGNVSAPSIELAAGVFRLTCATTTITWGTIYNPQNGWGVRFGGNTYGWHQYRFNDKQLKLFNTTGLKIAVLITDSYVYGLVDDGDGNLIIATDGNQTAKKENVKTQKVNYVDSIRTDFTSGKFTNVKVLPYISVDYEVSSVIGGSVKNVIPAYGDVKADIVTEPNYIIKAVKLNDTDVTSYVTDGKLSYGYYSTDKFVLSVELEKLSIVSGTLTGDNGNNTFKVYKNTVVKLSNSKNTYTTKVGDDGAYQFIGVKDGSYVLSVGSVTKTIIVSGDKFDANYTILYTAQADPYALTYRDQTVDDFVKGKYYSNLEIITVIADPAIIKITDPESEYFGEFFMYGTTDAGTGFRTYKSKDMVNWEYVSFCFDCTGGWEDGDLWAPEIIYDANADRAKLGLGEGKGVYYFFYSSTAHFVDFTSGCVLGLGVSTSPAGPFVRYVGYDQLGRFIDRNTPWLDIKTVHEVMLKKYGVSGTHAIDPTPFIDPETGEYYLFMTSVKACSFVGHDWSQIDYDSFTHIVKSSHNMISQEAANQVGAKYESYNTRTNEGPQVTYHNGKYYLTISINGYQDKGYSVLTCVADDVLGPYRKLKPDEGGILVSAVYGDDNTAQYGSESNVIDNLSGPGHHFMWQEGDELFIVYHRHEYVQDAPGEDYYYPSSGWYHTRYVAVDRVEWVKNKDGLEVMRCVGPTSSVQPIDYVYGQTPYDNIITDATITVSSGENVSALSDELLLVYEIDKDIIKEFTTTEEVTITISFDDYRTISGLLIYNSMYYEKLFKSVKKIEFESIVGQKFVTTYINNLAYPDDYYDSVKKVTYPGGAAVADFDELLCKTITITLEVPEGQSAIGVGEIIVLGIPE